MLCFLGGELSNATKYFTTFANVNQDDSNDITKSFNVGGSSAWKLFSYKQRLKDAEIVSKKKSELQKKIMKPETLRQNVTTFISKQLKSRQETVPPVENCIDKVKCEPLHLKNNVTKELFLKCMNLDLVEAKIPASVKCFKDIRPEKIFHKFIHFVKHDMNCNYLAKKLFSWFNENKKTKKDKNSGFLFRGKESYHYMHNFPNLIFMLKI